MKVPVLVDSTLQSLSGPVSNRNKLFTEGVSAEQRNRDSCIFKEGENKVRGGIKITEERVKISRIHYY